MNMRALLVIGLAALAAACGSSGKTLACKQSIDAYCAMSNAICPSLSQIQSAQTATAGKCASGLRWSRSSAPCGGYYLAINSGVDTGTDYYLDATTGKLTAIVGYSANFGGSQACAAGPSSGFSVPSCASTVPETEICAPQTL